MADNTQSRDRGRDAPAQGRSKERAKERPQDRPANRPADRPDTRSLADAMGQKARDSKQDVTPAVKVEEAVVTVGKSGEHNLSVDWIEVWVGNSRPCRFDVSTLPGNGLEVIVEQLAYKKTYVGTGALGTQPVPVVPIGTKFTIVSKDTTTGEILEQKGIWIDLSGGGSGGFRSLWAIIKSLLWKG